MRSYNVILFVALVTFSFSNAFEFTNLAEVKELRSSAYGNSLIETISLTLDNQGSIADVQKLLTDLEYKLNQDQEKADQEWTKEKNELDRKIEQLGTEITGLERTISTDKEELAAKEDLAKTARENIEQFNKQKLSNKAAYEKNEEKRVKDIAEFKASSQEHTDVVNAVGEVIKELQKLKGSISGEGKPAHVEDIAAETRDQAYKLQNSFVQVTRDETEALIFAQMATSADQDALNKLLKLLDEIRESAKQSLNDDESFEQNSKKLYEQLKSNLNNDNTALDKNIEDQDKNLKEYEKRIDDLKVKISENEKLLENKKKEKEETIKIRTDKENQYNQDKQERERELKVIKQLQSIVEKRLQNMSKFLRSETSA
jgi:hypothetical protein